MKRYFTLFMLMFFAIAIFADDEDEQKISTKDIPENIQKLIQISYPKAKIIGGELEDGGKIYEVEINYLNSTIELKYTQTGDLLEKEESLKMSALPKTIRNYLNKKYPKVSIEEQEFVQMYFYEIKLENGQEIKITPNAKIIELEENIAPKDLSNIIKNAVQKKYPKAQVKKVEKITLGKKSAYEMEIIFGEKEYEIKVDISGKILKESVEKIENTTNTLPKEIKDNIKARFPDGEIEEVETEFEDNKKLYEIKIKHSNLITELKYNEHADLLEQEQVISFGKLPKSVQKYIKSKYPKTSIKKVEAVQLNFYEIELTLNKKEHEIKINSNGELVYF